MGVCFLCNPDSSESLGVYFLCNLDSLESFVCNRGCSSTLSEPQDEVLRECKVIIFQQPHFPGPSAVDRPRAAVVS